MDDLVINERIVVPAWAMTMRAVRSGGPGGQNVNKVASKVELRVQIEAVRGMAPAATARLRRIVKNRMTEEGELLITSQVTRDQHRNLDDARDKLRRWIEEALVRPEPRIKTRPTRGSVERRIQEKKRRAEKKSTRRGWDD